MPRSFALCIAVGAALLAIAGAEDPYRFFNWNVTYGDIYPLGVRQQVHQSSHCRFTYVFRVLIHRSLRYEADLEVRFA